MDLFPRAGTEDKNLVDIGLKILESRFAEESEVYKVITSLAMHVDKVHIDHIMYFVHYN